LNPILGYPRTGYFEAYKLPYLPAKANTHPSYQGKRSNRQRPKCAKPSILYDEEQSSHRDRQK
ncbi:MAG: hypothetical protein QM608_18940, partial [Caulobacter sp.]